MAAATQTKKAGDKPSKVKHTHAFTHKGNWRTYKDFGCNCGAQQWRDSKNRDAVIALLVVQGIDFEYKPVKAAR